MFQATIDTEEVYIIRYLGVQEEYLTIEKARGRINELQSIDDTLNDEDFVLVHKRVIPVREPVAQKRLFWRSI